MGIKKAKKIKIKRFLFKNKKRPKVQQAAVKKVFCQTELDVKVCCFMRLPIESLFRGH